MNNIKSNSITSVDNYIPMLNEIATFMRGKLETSKIDCGDKT